MTKLWVQKWEESERGWGTRPDGYTLHLRRDDIDQFVKEMRAREQLGKPANYVPESYSRPDGNPYEWETDDEQLIEKVCLSAHGCYGTTHTPPEPPPGVKPGGWVRMRS